MEIYVAISDFKPPIVDGSQNILEFNKGDTFEIFDCHKTGADWWGARALKSNSIGYVPSRYMQYEERRIGKLLPTDYQDQKETSLKRLSDMQAEPDHKAPENMYDQQEEPEPDYNDDIDSDQLPVHLGPARTDRSGSEASDDGLQIQPKKLTNPCLESNTRQALHKELLLNYKRGVNVLEKPELNKVLSQRRDTQKRKEMQEQMANNRTSLEMKLELRAKKTDDDMKTISEKDEANKPELQKAFAKFAQKSNGHMK